MIKDTEALKTLPLFADLDAQSVERLAANSRKRVIARGQYLFMHGDDIHFFKIICRGTVHIFRETPDGHEVTSDILISGDCINADEIMSHQKIHRTSARAVDDATVLEVPIDWMRQHLKDFDLLAPRLLQGLSERLQSAQREAEQHTTFSASQIVACYLQGLCVLYDFDPRGFDLPYSKTLIASRLRMELATFSRTLPKLKSWGVTVTGNHVAFSHLNRAGEFVCDDCSIAEDCPTRLHLNQKVEKTASDVSDGTPKPGTTFKTRLTG